MDKLVAIVGPTAVGKTSIALDLAQKLKTEIISCDSMQIYRGMDIGTAKASIDERKKVSHHMIDVVDPDEDFSVAEFQQEAKEIIRKLNSENRLPLLVGGTGLYYQSVVDDYTFYPMESRQEIRQQWQAIIEKRGLDYAYSYLQSIDPRYAALISANDQKRIVRAIEVYQLTGKTFSSLQNKSAEVYDLIAFGLYLNREELYERINLRVDEMLAKGLIEEVLWLKKKGYGLQHNAMQALGYKQVMYYLDGFLSKGEMINEIKKETRRYAKRQYTWFKKDSRIQWINIKEFQDKADILEKISSNIEGRLSAV